MHRITCHKVSVKNTKNGLVSNDEKIILLTFEFENDRFETDGEIVIGLSIRLATRWAI